MTWKWTPVSYFEGFLCTCRIKQNKKNSIFHVIAVQSSAEGLHMTPNPKVADPWFRSKNLHALEWINQNPLLDVDPV